MFRSDWDMTEEPDSEAEGMLRQGLRLLPVPDSSLDLKKE